MDFYRKTKKKVILHGQAYTSPDIKWNLYNLWWYAGMGWHETQDARNVDLGGVRKFKEGKNDKWKVKLHCGAHILIIKIIHCVDIILHFLHVSSNFTLIAAHPTLQ